LQVLAKSGVHLTPTYQRFDAEAHFRPAPQRVCDDPRARCGDQTAPFAVAIKAKHVGHRRLRQRVACIRHHATVLSRRPISASMPRPISARRRSACATTRAPAAARC
jgi:hypothetical protein